MTKTNEKYPILYSFRRCPYAMRARLALLASGILVELREIVLRDKPAHMLEISPKGTVPVLQLQDGKVIDESLDIMIYALGRQDPDEWIHENEQDTDFLIKRNDGDFKYALDRYKYPDRYPDEDCTDMFDRGAEILIDLNARITENGSLIDDYDTLADFAIFPFVRQFAATDSKRFENLGLKPLEQWLDRHLESDLFTAIMEKYKPWQDGDEPILLQASHQA
jgi:glutathione S-transferase